ncbi:MAG: glutamate-5-semialdehyde dehydrogenase [Clostridiales bacterium]|nr:glutamate-5-semialdehyde dehydrogenase [Clostridiales bacterium]
MADQYSIQEMSQMARQASFKLAATSLAKRNEALQAIADAIVKNKQQILEANAYDIAEAKDTLSAPLLSRLKLNDDKCARMVDGVLSLIELADPLGSVNYAKELADRLNLYRVACPIGVVGIIFESRPDALVQISTLCLKSGNTVLLKGGREAAHTNEILAKIIVDASVSCGLPENWCGLLHSREDVQEMLKQHDSIDLIIPRGSNEFVRYIMKNSEIPVLGHSDGLCHVYVDDPCDLKMAVKLAVDSKAQNLSVCNTAETLLVHQNIAGDFLPKAAKALADKEITLYGDEKTQGMIACLPACEEDWETEYLDAKLSIKIVASIDEAIDHINHYGSHHTDSIVSSDINHVNQFFSLVDSADVFHNCSTRFADGFLFGFGAEVGIATGKLHARGPMGMEGLCTYKYRLYGSGQTLTDLNNGQITLTHNDIQKRLP